MTTVRLSGPARSGELLDGRYRLDEPIGEGGMGTVWRAFDETLGRTVAVKIFWPGTTEETDAVRRESEKRLLASLSHPSLVTLFDAQLTNEGRSYLVMEYIDGGTLGTLIARGPVRVRDAASLTADLGEALHVVHSAGIVHRDVKPANILLRPPLTSEHTFRAVLADFGIAYLADAARVTTPGLAMGTAAYISPEQVRGEAPSPASDIYSLGLVLLESLSGKRAFPQRTPIEAISVRLTTPPQIPGDWGYGWRSLLTAMTAIDPQERPTALEVAVRGRVLDSDDVDAQLTSAVVTSDRSEADAVKPVPRPREASAATTVTTRREARMPVRPAPDEVTKVLPPVPPLPADMTAALPDPSADSPSPRRTARRSEIVPGRRRLGVIAAAIAAALLIAAVVVGLNLLSNASSSSESPPPDLPQVGEPLQTHLEELMDRVTP